MTDNLRNLFAEAISPIILLALFSLAVVAFIVISMALTYHWRNYNVNSKLVGRLTRVYFWVSGIFLAGMAAALFQYLP
jgi:ABC-type polysaccharide/polyol phosphate export permease